MLTGKMVRVRFARDHIVPQYLDTQDAQWLEVAEQLLGVFRTRMGTTRGELDAEIEELFGDLPQPLIHQGLAKLLEDRCEFEVHAELGPEAVRAAVFTAAARRRQGLLDVVGAVFSRGDIIQHAATELNAEPAQIEASLFADLKREQRLTQFHDTTPARLLERYNVALAQAVLLRSVGVEIVIQGESPQRYRQLFRQIKFRRLICEIEVGRTNALHIRLDGPLSLFAATQKYGLQLALFLPTLLLCEQFELKANLRWGTERKAKVFALSATDGLVSHQAESGSYVPPEVPMFVEMFQKKIADWEIHQETEIVPVGKSFWIPDYRLVHRATKGSVLLDIFGFWRRANIQRHVALLKEAGRPFVLALSDQFRVEEEELAELPGNVVRFRNLPLPEEVARCAAAALGF